MGLTEHYRAAKRWTIPELEIGGHRVHEIKVLQWVFLPGYFEQRSSAIRSSVWFWIRYSLIISAPSGSSLPCTVTWTIHFRQNSSTWFSESQIAWASRSKSKGCQKVWDKDSFVCLPERCLRHGRPAVGNSPTFLFLCALGWVSIQVFCLSALLLSSQHSHLCLQKISLDALKKREHSHRPLSLEIWQSPPEHPGSSRNLGPDSCKSWTIPSLEVL